MNRIVAYAELHLDIGRDSLRRLGASPLSSVLTVLVIAIALALPASFRTLTDNAEAVAGQFKDSHRLSVFLKPELSDDTGRKLVEKWRKDPRVAEIRLITKSEGLDELRTYSGFGDALQALNVNPLPVVLSIRPTASIEQVEQLEALSAALRSIPEADFVQIDTEWLHKLRVLLDVSSRSAALLAVLLSGAVVFIVGNTVRLELHHRREEINVTRLLGASRRFVRRPFLYTGFWYGLFGGIAAEAIVIALILALNGPVRELATLYGSDFELALPSFPAALKLIATAAALCLIATWAVVTWHLHELDRTD